ncbi:MAG TPA: hypothetical protein VGW75_02505, partial [Solirubrobacteraceae bacterium]|nr:hypothetical protein [Solirubrobacteraceae bacterium]
TIKSAFEATIQPIKESYEKGGLSEAIGRGVPTAVGAIVGGKGLTKLGKFAKHGREIPSKSKGPDGGSNWRIAPFGNRKTDKMKQEGKKNPWYRKAPHYHRRGPGGIKRHRPWQRGPGGFRGRF